MLALINPQPVGFPGLILMMLGFVAFLAALMLAGSKRGVADAAPDKQRRSRISILGIAVQVLAFFAIAVGPLRLGLAPTSPAAIGEGAVVLLLMAFNAGLFLASSRAMGRNWSVVARTRSDHELVTWGPFAHVRNPIYVGLFAYMVAMAVAFGHWNGLIAGAPVYWLGTWLRVAEEEKLLRAQFGDAYDVYARRVKRFVPGIV